MMGYSFDDSISQSIFLDHMLATEFREFRLARSTARLVRLYPYTMSTHICIHVIGDVHTKDSFTAA